MLNRQRCALFLLFVLVVPSHVAPSTAEDNGQLHSIKTGVSGNDPCIVYAYDANGNRLSQTITVSGGGMTPTWGTGTWGCFSWTP